AFGRNKGDRPTAARFGETAYHFTARGREKIHVKAGFFGCGRAGIARRCLLRSLGEPCAVPAVFPAASACCFCVWYSMLKSIGCSSSGGKPPSRVVLATMARANGNK